MTNGLIAVSGATGGVGRRVARRLADRGLQQRLLARDPARLEVPTAAEVRAIPGYHARTEVRKALDGVSTFFFIPGAESQTRTSDQRATIEAAGEAGVRHIVYLSFVGASPESTFTFARDHWATEEDVRRVAPAFTFLRMNTYLDFVPKLAGPDGLISGPAGDGRVSAVLRDDLADVAAAVLASADDHVGRTYDVTGGEAFTLAEAAAEMSRVGGRKIVFRNETLQEAYQARSGHGAADWEVEGWVSSYTAIAAGELAAVSDVVQRLAGHPPVTLAGYVTANPESLAHVRR